MATKVKPFRLIDLPDYDYTTGLACPECYAPVARNRVDGRCDSCLKSKAVLPVNYRRVIVKKHTDDDEYNYEDLY